MDLLKHAEKIRKILNKRREEISLDFEEEGHIYHMKNLDGELQDNFPSVSTVIGKFHSHFDAEGKALEKAYGNVDRQQEILQEWADAGNYATNMGSRVHFRLEEELIKEYGNYKVVRKPIFECDETQIEKGNAMITAGLDYIQLMHDRGAVLLDTEVVLGDPEIGYVGQPDKTWLIPTKDKTNFGIVTTDWKGLPIHTQILTEFGWSTMSRLRLNDKVFDKDGNLVKIKHISNVKNVKCLKIKFDNNEEIVSDYEHRWLVYTQKGKKTVEKIMTTQEIKDYYDNLKDRKSHQILRIKNPKPLNLPERELPIDPYVFGMWLGNGHSSCGMITQMNSKVWTEIENRGYTLGEDVLQGNSGKAQSRTIFGLRTELNKLRLINNKYLPEIFLLSSYEQRLDLLRGLMDSNGIFNKSRNRFYISATKESQVNFSKKILSSLGLKPTVIQYSKKLNNKDSQCYNIEFTTDIFNPFLCRNQDISFEIKSDRSTFRRINDIIEVESTPTICIEVDSPSSTYLFGETLCVTHNTNQPKNFLTMPYHDMMYRPFSKWVNNALGHYYVQLPLYGKLLIKMLEGTEYENLKILGNIIVLLKCDATFEEFRVPQEIGNIVNNITIKNYL